MLRSQLIEKIDPSAILANLILLLRLLAFSLVPVFFANIIAADFKSSLFLALLILSSLLYSYFSRSTRETRLNSKEALIITALAYLLFSFCGALLYYFNTGQFWNGLFESLSGFTTTGLSVYDPSTLSVGLLFFRAYSQWIGGAGIIVFSILILVGHGKNSFRLYTTEFGEENLFGNARATLLMVIRIYFTLTVVGFLALWISGLSPFNSLLYTLTSLSTGGFSPLLGSMGTDFSLVTHLVFITLMICGAMAFPTFYLLSRRQWKRILNDVQLRFLIVIILLSTGIILAFAAQRPESWFNVLFQTSSALTTTGFSTLAYSEQSDATRFLSIFLMMIGGSTGSTAGGLKVFRFVILIKLLRWFIDHTLLPKEVKLPIQYNNKSIDDQELRRIGSLVVLYLFIMGATCLVFTLHGYAVIDSLYESASALGTVGLSSGITGPELPLGLKLLLMLNMWAGRLEILPVLVIFHPAIWRRTK